MQRENLNHIKTSDIYKEFFNLKDISNVIRVLDLEKNFLDKKLDTLRKFIDKLKNKNRKKK